MNRPAMLLVALPGAALGSVLIVALALGLPAKLRGPLVAAHGHAVHSHVDAGTSGPATPVGTRSKFYAEMAQVNARMHEAMQAAPTGDPDFDFLQLMIPHHQGAIDMALIVLKYGHDKRLKRLAQSIIVEQGQEITYMRTLLGAPLAEQVTSHQ